MQEKIRKDLTGGTSKVFTKKAVANEMFIRKSINLCKSFVLMVVNSILILCQDMPTCLYTRWDYNEETKKNKARQNRVQTFENMAMSYFQATRPESKI